MDEKLHMGVRLVPMIERYEEIVYKFHIFTVFWAKLISFAPCFCYDWALSVAERAHFLALDTSLAT